MQVSIVAESLQNMRSYYNSGATKPYEFRKEQLKKLSAAGKADKHELHNALYADLKKAPKNAGLLKLVFYQAK